jgi:NADH dehydrogenase FAD-containing subunit
MEKYPQMKTQLEQTLQALEGVTQEELEWKPVQHEKVRTIGDMMRHIVQAEDTFINRFIMGQDVQPRTPQTNPTTESLMNDFKSLRGRTMSLWEWHLVEGLPRVLNAFPPELSVKAVQQLERLGVEVRTGTPVTAVDSEGVVAGVRIPAATVIWAAGVAASPLGSFLGVPLDRNGRVVVEPDLTVPGRPDVFVIGDLALYTHQGGAPLPGVSPVAMQEGRAVARTIADRLAGRPARPFRYLDKGTMAVVGRSAAVAEVFGVKLAGLPAWLAWCFLHIFYLIGFRNRFVVMFEWAWSYFSSQRGARLITGDIEHPRSR